MVRLRVLLPHSNGSKPEGGNLSFVFLASRAGDSGIHEGIGCKIAQLSPDRQIPQKYGCVLCVWCLHTLHSGTQTFFWLFLLQMAEQSESKATRAVRRPAPPVRETKDEAPGSTQVVQNPKSVQVPESAVAPESLQLHGVFLQGIGPPVSGLQLQADAVPEQKTFLQRRRLVPVRPFLCNTCFGENQDKTRLSQCKSVVALRDTETGRRGMQITYLCKQHAVGAPENVLLILKTRAKVKLLRDGTQVLPDGTGGYAFHYRQSDVIVPADLDDD